MSNQKDPEAVETVQTESIKAVDPAAICSAALPSWFAAQGRSNCSMWCKTEIEILALAYVVAQSRLGDTWRRVTPAECWAVLDEDEKRYCSPYLSNLVREEFSERYARRWQMIADQLTSAEGAFEVGGMAWCRHRFIQQNKHAKRARDCAQRIADDEEANP